VFSVVIEIDKLTELKNEMLIRFSVCVVVNCFVVLIIDKNSQFVVDASSANERQTIHGRALCLSQSTSLDDTYNPSLPSVASRRKRFVLNPELNDHHDWRHLQRSPDIHFWIANFYPDKLDSDLIRRDIRHIIEQINLGLEPDITIDEAADANDANFFFYFFDYTICPTNDPSADQSESIQAAEPLSIYSPEITRASRYRAHGGIYLSNEKKAMSIVKLNMQQKFITSDDYIYDPVQYTCIEDTNICEIDLYYVLLHESLHGFGVEVIKRKENNAKQTTVVYSSTRSVSRVCA
jgi:hypothetical protein